MKIPAKYLAAASEFQAKKDMRYMLNGIALVQKADHIEIVATNGHVLLKIDHESAETDSEWSRIVAFSTDQLRDLRKKGNADKIVTLDFQNETMLLNGCLSPISIIDGTYPDYSRIITNKREPNGTVPAFNATYWQSFAKAATLLSESAHSPIKVLYGAVTESALVEFPEALNAVGVIMPVKA